MLIRKLGLVLLFAAAPALVSCSKSAKSTAVEPVVDPVVQDENRDTVIPEVDAEGPLKDIRFSFDSSKLTSEAQGILQMNASWLMQNPDKRIVVEGHCDERGTNEYNLALGERRAKSAYNFLKTLGVSAERMSIISYGEEVPLDPRHSEDAWAKNRRARFSVVN